MAPPSIRANLAGLEAAHREYYSEYINIAQQETRHELDMLHLQQYADRQREMVAARSNLQKAHHDAMMNVISNMK